jgi:ATP-binding protein involved in chromosome partitioning
MAVDQRRDEVLAQLSTVKDPDLGRDLVSLGMIQDLSIQDSNVNFSIVLTTPACPVKDDMRNWARTAVARLPWVKDVNVNMRSNTAGRARGSEAPLIPGVRNVVAIASGKGGVGKSTTSVNVALALAETGAKVGLLDADIYGPNIPLMMGLKARPQIQGTEGHMQPVDRYGVKLMSIGFFLDEDNPVIWRGPMIHGALQQFLRDVEWGELDYLVVDLPPGTGDAPLSLSQLVPLSGAVMVTTPQDVALQDVYKGMSMFKKLEVPIIGVIENMSYFVCPSCDTKHEIFGRGGGEKLAKHFAVPFLGKVPLQPDVRVGGDEGQPVVLAQPNAPASEAFRKVAGEVARHVSIMALSTTSGFIPLQNLTINR